MPFNSLIKNFQNINNKMEYMNKYPNLYPSDMSVYSSKCRSTSKDSRLYHQQASKKHIFNDQQNKFQYHANQMIKSGRTTERPSSSSDIKRTVQDVSKINWVADKLCYTLKSEHKCLQNFKAWTERQKQTIETQFQNITSEVTNFLNKNKQTLTQSLDKLYLEMLDAYKQLKIVSKNLYSQRKHQNNAHKKVIDPQWQTNNQLTLKNSKSLQLQNNQIVNDLIRQKQLYNEYYQTHQFYQKHQKTFQILAHKIQTISDLSQNQLLEDLNVQLSIKQFQNYLYSSLKQIKNKLIWDQQPDLCIK